MRQPRRPWNLSMIWKMRWHRLSLWKMINCSQSTWKKMAWKRNAQSLQTIGSSRNNKRAPVWLSKNWSKDWETRCLHRYQTLRSLTSSKIYGLRQPKTHWWWKNSKHSLSVKLRKLKLLFHHWQGSLLIQVPNLTNKSLIGLSMKKLKRSRRSSRPAPSSRHSRKKFSVRKKSLWLQTILLMESTVLKLRAQQWIDWRKKLSNNATRR